MRPKGYLVVAPQGTAGEPGVEGRRLLRVVEAAAAAHGLAGAAREPENRGVSRGFGRDSSENHGKKLGFEA